MVTLRRHRRTAVLFALLSGADLALTSQLLQHGDGQVYEANWVAAAVLARYGLAGLAVFKGLLVVLAGGLVAIVSAYRPRAARRLAAFACLAVGVVVLYSLALWGRQALQPASFRSRLAMFEQETQRVEAFARNRKEFRALLERWTQELAAGRCELAQTLTALLTCNPARKPGFLAAYRAVGGKSDAESLAAIVVNGAILSLREDGSQRARLRAEQLRAAYEAEYDPAILAPLVGRHHDLMAQRSVKHLAAERRFGGRTISHRCTQ